MFSSMPVLVSFLLSASCALVQVQAQTRNQAQTADHSAYSAPSKAAATAGNVQEAEGHLLGEQLDFTIPQIENVARFGPNGVLARGNLRALLYFRGKDALRCMALGAALILHNGLTHLKVLLGTTGEHTGTLPPANLRLATLYRRAGHQQDASKHLEIFQRLRLLTTRRSAVYQKMRQHPGSPPELWVCPSSFGEARRA